MRPGKIKRRLAQARRRPELWNSVARDLGVALARGERENVHILARELAAHAPAEREDEHEHRAEHNDAHDDAGDAQERGPKRHYWAGFAAAMGIVLASYEAEHGHADARMAAMRVIVSPGARQVLCELARGPAIGAVLASRLQLTPGGVSRILKNLRSVGLVRIAGGPDARGPERGAAKPHILTPLGAAIADEVAAHPDSKAARAATT